MKIVETLEKIFKTIFSYFTIILVRLLVFMIVLVASIAIFSSGYNVDAKTMEKAKNDNSALTDKLAKLNKTLTEQKNLFASSSYMTYEKRIKAEQKAAEEKAAAAKAAAEKKAAAQKAAADKKAAEEAEKKAAAEKAAAEKQEIADIKKNMNVWTGYPVCIAVSRIIEKRSTGSHTANGNGIFVYVDAAAYNDSKTTVHVNPNDFTLSTSTGYTVSHYIDTYGLSNYFDDVSLAPGQQTSGYLIFYITKDTRYTLNYQGFDGTASKELMP